MPSFGNTPEALLGRNDSKNPATTCKGLTGSGRPCRRAIAASRIADGRRVSEGGVVAVTEDEDGWIESDYYCWQHKDQAGARLVEGHAARWKAGKRVKKNELYDLQERTSIDTLVQRLGLEDGSGTARPPQNSVPKPPRMTEEHHTSMGYSEKPDRRSKPKPRKRGFWSSLCCLPCWMESNDDDYMEVVRHRKRVNQHQSHQSQKPQTASVPPARPSPQNSQSQQLLSLIPSHVSPQISSNLLAELIKPFSPTDEDGYIYIFWLTPQNQQAPSEQTARSLLTPTRPEFDRRISDVLTEYSFDEPPTSTRDVTGRNNKTVMLKIGRANNVTRRMNEWQRQCGYALNLIRWYPHASNPASPPRRQPETAVRKVPHVKRVERLIHLELSEQQVKRDCAACGKEHREWFRVEANQAGVRRVDDCIKKWIDWAEKQAL